MSKKPNGNLWTDVFLVLPDLSDYVLKLDEEFINKRQNRYIMEENKQLRDKNGHFASKEGAPIKKSSKKKEAAVDWQAAYDKKVLELQTREGVIKKLEEKIGEQEETIKEMDSIIERLQKENSEANSRARFFEDKNDQFFDTIERQNSHNSELREQLEWFKEKLPLCKRAFYLRTLQEMHERLCYLRMRVLESMNKWK